MRSRCLVAAILTAASVLAAVAARPAADNAGRATAIGDAATAEAPGPRQPSRPAAGVADSPQAGNAASVPPALATALSLGAPLAITGLDNGPIPEYASMLAVEGAEGKHATAPPASVAQPSVSVLYTFNTGAVTDVPPEGNRPTASGDTHTLHPQSARGGQLATFTQGNRRGIRFPAPCANTNRQCPRAVLSDGVRPSTELNPGTRPLRYGATIHLASAEVSDGQNLLQKGFAKGGSQFKLQVDGLLGNPTCVISKGSHQYVARASVTVADGRWHSVDCSRSGPLLTITVDGIPYGAVAVPPALDISNTEPLRIGGKGTSANNDQFHGELDNAYVSIG